MKMNLPLFLACLVFLVACKPGFTDTSPEGILGERSIETKISGSLRGPVSKVYLLYATDSLLVVNTSDTSSAMAGTTVGINRTQDANASYVTILPHSRNQAFSLNGNVPMDMLKADTKLYYKWLAYHQSQRLSMSKVRSFILPRPLNMAVMGDSYASGEGAPVSPGAQWRRRNCHRSANGGQFLAVRQFAEQHANIAVEFENLYVSCSGARVDKLLKSNYDPPFCDDQGTEEDPQLQQLLDALVDSKLTGKIDAVVLSIGGNDMGFGGAVKDIFLSPGTFSSNAGIYTQKIALMNELYKEVGRFLDSLCVEHVFITNYPNPTQGDTDGMQLCGMPPAFFEFLIQSVFELIIQSHINNAGFICDFGESIIEFVLGDDNQDNCSALHVLDSEYYSLIMDYLVCNSFNADPEALVDALVFYLRLVEASPDWDTFMANLETAAATATCPALDPAYTMDATTVGMLTTLLASRADITAARDVFLIPLNDTMASASEALGWHCINDVFQNSTGKGLCACHAENRFFNGMDASFRTQGTMYGTMHMNEAGQRAVFLPSVSAKLDEVLSPRANRMAIAESASCFRLPETSETYEEVQDKLTALDEEMIDNNIDKFLALKNEVGDKIKWIIDIMDTKTFKAKYREAYEHKKFAKMREGRL